MGNKTVSFDDFPIAIYMMSWSPQVSGSQREEQRSRPPPWKQQESHQDKRPRERECPSYIFGVKVFFYKLGLVIWNMSPIFLYTPNAMNQYFLRIHYTWLQGRQYLECHPWSRGETGARSQRALQCSSWVSGLLRGYFIGFKIAST